MDKKSLMAVSAVFVVFIAGCSTVDYPQHSELPFFVSLLRGAASSLQGS